MRVLKAVVAALWLGLCTLPADAAAREDAENAVLLGWYDLVLELVRHTATYSPPVASRAFAYVGVVAHEVQAGGDPALVSLAGQLNGLAALPARDPALPYDDAVALEAALARAMGDFFGNTGPSGQRAMAAVHKGLATAAAEGLDAAMAERSRAWGEAVADHVYQWSLTDGGAVIENMGFPLTYTPGSGPDDWVPTNTQALQQAPLLPGWGENRPFAMPVGVPCKAPPYPAFATGPGTGFYEAAQEVYETSKVLTDEQKAIARFWSDDPMLSPTPPGHWVAIVLQIARRDGLSADRTAEALAVVGVAVADAFIGCWSEKFRHNLIRPVTYIRRHIDPKWEPLLITPPFPEYPSGHSVQSGAAEVALTRLFGEGFAFDDATHEDDGLPVRHFGSFREAAEEAAVSRLFGGIHFPFGNRGGLVQGRCIGDWAARLKTRS
ncbi:vanadium-dependent haloperoxidase [Rhodobacter sp. Har01]|uniref:vanadium-dependent haloperoxidase n=1 Tax=Rhodobacter sp. Har01 TaxID=2883999 RepID=UPI001D079D15|nr:vanadium-dependent haloperoxidase [Rhodobacter sp. Har01]MCB6176596.1 vanadium-dependent haloperoxidase [Rhodobacter sp. Har01]